MFTGRVVLLSSMIFLSAGWLRADMVLDTTCMGTHPVAGTAFQFQANAFGSGACPTDSNLVFANTGSSSWFNLDITAKIPVGFALPPEPCGFAGTPPFRNCTTAFDGSTRVYSALFFGTDDSHPGIQISTPTTNTDGGPVFNHEFGFDFSGFPANQVFNANANVPEPSYFFLLLLILPAVGLWMILKSGTLPSRGGSLNFARLRASGRPR